MSERTELKGNLNTKQNELNSCVNEAAFLNAKIEKIKELIKDFKILKSDLKMLKKELDQMAKKEFTYWIGNRRNKYQDIIGNDLSNSSLHSYIGNVDDNLDELNNELMRLENELHSMEGMIGSIKSAINWIATKLENIVN